MMKLIIAKCYADRTQRSLVQSSHSSDDYTYLKITTDMMVMIDENTAKDIMIRSTIHHCTAATTNISTLKKKIIEM